MIIHRRDFLKAAGAAAGGLLLPIGAEAEAQAARFPLHKRIVEGRSVCPYCSVGCGVIIATDQEGQVVNTEGDPEHPINRGGLDPKSISITQLSQSPLRLRTVRYRAPGSDRWEDKPWDWAIAQIAQRVKATRDATFVERNAQGTPVNRTEAIAWLGGAANNSEDCYLGAKLMRALGVLYLEHQARV
jgi:formate dehydrogenase major subunit